MTANSPTTSKQGFKILANVVVGIIFVAVISLSPTWLVAPLFLFCVAGATFLVVRQLRAEGRANAAGLAVDYRKLAATDMDKLLPWLKENLRGHDAVVDAIFEKLKKNVQLARAGRTLGNFLLVGPTGTGKKFLAQLVASGLYRNSEVVLLAMNQFRQPGDVLSLIGSPPGMPGYEIGGRLTRPVLENPYRVVIFDDVEKAHHDLHDCLQDILDTATCREKSSGQLVDFSGCVFFGTSNAGVEKLRALTEEVDSQATSAWLGRSRDILAEAGKLDRAFLSRWDGVFLLDTLPPVHVAEVACLQLSKYCREYGIEIEYADPELILDAVQRNADFAEYGVRQLGRIIRERTEGAILEAKRNGSAKVSLRVGESTGNLEIEVPR